MTFEEYAACDLLGLADLISRREVTSREVVETAIARLAAVNPALNAVVDDYAESALARAGQASDGPFHGVPYLFKHHAANLEGTATSLGSPVFAGLIRDRDSALVSTLRRAGLIPLGKTNLPEMSNDAVTESTLYGPARNPWNLAHSPGGSSGGSAAAVAAGIVPAAHGSDGGGSIRIPAACTGLFGLKPSRGRVSLAPAGEMGAGFVVQHAITRTVRDSAALLDVSCRPQPGDPYWLEPPTVPFLSVLSEPVGRLRIKFSTKTILPARMETELADAVEAAASLCEEMGHEVEYGDLAVDYPYEANGIVVAAGMAATLAAEEERRGRPLAREEVSNLTWSLYRKGLKVNSAEYVRAIQACHAYQRELGRFFTSCDVFLNATTAQSAPRIGALRGDSDDLQAYAGRLVAFMPNTKFANIGGQPSMSVPFGLSRNGLPIGVQFTAATGRDATLFRLAGQMEAARPWKHLRPPEPFVGASHSTDREPRAT